MAQWIEQPVGEPLDLSDDVETLRDDEPVFDSTGVREVSPFHDILDFPEIEDVVELEGVSDPLEPLRAAVGRFEREVWESPRMLSPEEIAGRLKVRVGELATKRRDRALIGVELEDLGVRYPDWQLSTDVRPHLTKILLALKAASEWEAYRFFVEPEPVLDGQTPLEALKHGRGDDVLRVASLLAEDAGR
jgi:hypothetical protein